VVSLTAIVPATNDPPTLAVCTRAIQRAEAGPEQLLVVRDADRPGPAAARNEGARAASGEVLVFVDADIEIHPDAFLRIRRAFAADPELGAVFGSYDDRPHSKGLVSVFRNLLHHHVHQSSAGPATTFWGGIGAIRRDAFELVGGFDQERFARPSVEDIELGMRLTAVGTQIVLDPTIQGTHLKRWTLAQMVRTDLFQRGIPWVELLVESRNGSSALNLGWRHRLSTLAVLVGFAGLAARRPFVATGSLGTLVLLNRSFYALLARQRGRREAVVGVGLHSLHHLIAAVSVPAGLLRHGLRRLGTDS
jgi:glycosyltransferase involved in cell wall biosynthesis